MSSNFHESLDETAVALPPDRSTGLVLASALAIVALVWRTNPAVMAISLTLALPLALVSLTAPELLRPLNVAWMGLGRLLGRVVSPIVMLVLFCTTIVPFGLAMQLKRDPLRRRPTETDETFWIVPDTSFGPPDMTRQF